METSITRFFSPKFKKVNICAIYNAITFFREYSYGKYLQTLEKKEILIQPPGEPQEQHLGDVQPNSNSYTKFQERQNDPEGRYTQAHF